MQIAAALRSLPGGKQRRLTLLAFNAGYSLCLIHEHERRRRQQRASIRKAAAASQRAAAERRAVWSRDALAKAEQLLRSGNVSLTQACRLAARQVREERKLKRLSYRTVARELARAKKLGRGMK